MSTPGAPSRLSSANRSEPQTSFQSNIQPHDLKPMVINGSACRFTLNDATEVSVFDGGLAVDTLRQLLYLPESRHPYLRLLQKRGFKPTTIKGILDLIKDFALASVRITWTTISTRTSRPPSGRGIGV